MHVCGDQNQIFFTGSQAISSCVCDDQSQILFMESLAELDLAKIYSGEWVANATCNKNK